MNGIPIVLEAGRLARTIRSTDMPNAPLAEINVIGSRRLFLEGDPGRVIEVQIGMPEQIPDEIDFRCPYRVTGLGDERVRFATGVDAIQALEEAIYLLPHEVNALFRKHPSLRWEDGDPGFFGFRPMR